MNLTTLQKQCFDSNGSKLTGKVKLSVYAPSVISDLASDSLTSESTGGEDGPLHDMMELTGSKYPIPQEALSTATSSDKLKVKIVCVTTN